MQRKSEGRGRKLRWTEQMILIIIAVIILPLMIVIGVLWNSMSQTFEEQRKKARCTNGLLNLFHRVIICSCRNGSFCEESDTLDGDTSQVIDYWITVGDTPAKLIEKYTAVTGRPCKFPHFASGFWQSKLRYRTQKEVISVAREYKSPAKKCQ